MKILFAFLIVWIGSLAAGSSFSAAASEDLLTPAERAWLAAHPDVVLGAGEDLAGTVLKDERGSPSGFIVDYLDLVNRKLGTKVRIEIGPWHEIVKKAESGAIDGLALTPPLDERRKHFRFTEVFHTWPSFIYLRTGDLQKQNVPLALDNLRGKRVGYLNRSLREARVLARYPEITAVPVDGYAELAQRLLRGDLDAVVASYSLEYWRASKGIVGMTVTRIIYEVNASMVMSINKERPELVAILNKGLAAVTKSEFEVILRRWFGSDYINRAAGGGAMRLSAEEHAWLASRYVIRIGIDPRSAPIALLDEKGAARGIVLAYIERMSKALGVRFDVRSTPAWADATQALEDGSLDVLAAISSTASRRQQLHYTDPYLSFPASIFSATDVTYIKGPEGLNGKTVSVVRGDAAEDWLRENWPHLQLLPVVDTAAALKTITDGRAYAFIGNRVTTSYAIGDAGLLQIRVAGEVPFDYQIAMGVRGDWPLLAGILQKGINAIPATERDAIYREGISIRYQHHVDYTWLWRVSGAAALILLLTLAVGTHRLKRLNARLQRLARDLSQVEENERRRLAGELHDSSMQKLALAQMQFSAASRKDSGLAASLANGLGLMREALDELRTLQFELSPPPLYREGLASALKWLAASATERIGVAVSFQDAAPTVQVPQDVAIALFQIARELTYNVAKHAAARTASIVLGSDDNHFVLSVADDGKGFGESSGARLGEGGFGLFAIRERVELFGGKVSVETSNTGSRVSIRMPLRHRVETATGPAAQFPDSLWARRDEVTR